MIELILFVLLSIIVATSLSTVILYRKAYKRVPNVESEHYAQSLIERIQELRLELWKYKRKPSGVASYFLLFFGALAIALSIIYMASILAFIGLGLIFWGVLFLFARPVSYVKSSLLDSTSFPSLVALNRVIVDLNVKGKGVHLPPRYLKGLKEGTVFIPSEKYVVIPPVEEVAEGNVFLKNPKGICLTSTGLGLVNLFEEELGTSFTKVGLNYLQNNLPKLFIEGLEIAEDFKMYEKRNVIHVIMRKTIYNGFCREVRKLSNVCGSIGCPLCSSIACALSRSTGKSVIIQKNRLSEDGKVIEVYYQIVE